MIGEDDKLSSGFNSIGFSQGGQFLSVIFTHFIILLFPLGVL